MQVLVQPIFKDQLRSQIVDKNYQLDSEADFYKNYDAVVGDLDFYQGLTQKKYSAQKISCRVLVIEKNTSITNLIYSQIQPTAILDSQELAQIGQVFHSAEIESVRLKQSAQARADVESKRDELEKLNDFLVYQDKERSNALKIFHNEEQLKKQHEKQLLFFLDFINSNYAHSHFLDELLKFIWSEVKKIGIFYQLGIVVKFDDDDQAVLFQYDDKKYYSQRSVQFSSDKIVDSAALAGFLANLYQRPVGKMLLWQQLSSRVQFYVFLESQGKEYKSKEVDLFFSDRLSLLSLIISRWVTEESEKTLLKQWRNTFKAYKDPIHVIDENYNIIQSNYVSKAETGKCYEVLAGLKQPCISCPLIKSEKPQNFVQIHNEDYQVHLTGFESNEKKYYILFYENITEVNSLKSQLVQSEKMSTIGNLANHLAHELNNPLTGLKLSAEFLIAEIQHHTSSAVANSLQNDLNEVLKATQRSEIIIRDLLDFSSEKAKTMQQIDFAVVLKKTMTLLKSVLRNNRVFIDVKSYMVHAQPVYLQQVLFNLIKNACEAMGQQGNIKIYQGAPHPKYSDFIIEDNGPGISAELAADIFKPFFTTKKEGEGTGLGLYLCANLMSKMNGELIYDKNFKTGARFILRFKHEQ